MKQFSKLSVLAVYETGKKKIVFDFTLRLRILLAWWICLHLTFPLKHWCFLQQVPISFSIFQEIEILVVYIFGLEGRVEAQVMMQICVK